MYQLALLLSSLLISSTVFAKEYRKTIAVIDTGINKDYNLTNFICEKGIYDTTGKGPKDNINHGTNIAGLITDGLDSDEYCIYVIKFYDESNGDYSSMSAYLAALKRAKELKPDYLNLSLNGPLESETEYQLLKDMLSNGTKVTTASGNEGFNLDLMCNSFPACLRFKLNNPNFKVIGSKRENMLENYSNYGKIVSDWRNGTNRCYKRICVTGTSQATAVFLNDWIKGNTK